MKFILIAALIVGAGSAVASTQSPYAGEELTDIKSLNPVEISGLLQGKGMGFAKTAELNQYPGPLHVLELAEQLHLSTKQIDQTNAIFKKMHEKAIRLEVQLVDYERELDKLFSSDQISNTKLDGLLLKIGETRAKLRGAHLHAHLEMKKVLSNHQVKMYDNLRGYSNERKSHKHTH